MEFLQELGETIVQWLTGALDEYRPVVVVGVSILFLMYVGYRLTARAILGYMKKKGKSAGQIKMAKLMLRYFFGLIGLVYLVSIFSGSLAALGLTTAFITMILGWSLQRPVTGMAAWLMVMVKRPFAIGDRVIIGGTRGDVVDISLTHILLNEVGGTIGGEENSNRGILIPNAVLFDQTVINYTLDSPYIMDEVVVRITYKSDWKEAESILVGAAREVTGKILAETGTEPFIRADLFEAGVNMRLRYQTPSTDRVRVSSEIVKLVFQRFSESDSVEFCYPHSEVLYSYKHRDERSEAVPPPVGRLG